MDVRVVAGLIWLGLIRRVARQACDLRHRPRAALAGCALLWLTSVAATAQDFPPERIRAGAEIFARNCSPCHGTRMQNPESAFDLRKISGDQHDRFVASVLRGRNQMPPWGDLLTPDEVEALWAYVIAGETK